MASAQPWSSAPFGRECRLIQGERCKGRGGEEIGVGGGGDRGPGVAEAVRNDDVVTRGDIEDALATRCDGQALKEARAEEPCGEEQPGKRGEEILHEAASGANAIRAGGPVEEKGGRCPSPGFLDEVDVEDVAFVCKVVGGGERVGKVGKDGVGGVEKGIVDGRIGDAEHKRRGDGGKSSTHHAVGTRQPSRRHHRVISRCSRRR